MLQFYGNKNMLFPQDLKFSISIYATWWHLNFKALEKLNIVIGEQKVPEEQMGMKIVNIETLFQRF